MTAGFIGGSISQGAEGGLNPVSWAAYTANWLRGKYDSVTPRDLAYPGTGSEFAAYRLRSDLGASAPDLAFIEFAVNDAGASRSSITAHTDAIIDLLRQRNPAVQIFYVATTQSSDAADRTAGREPALITFLRQFAATENIQFIDVGAAVWKDAIANGLPITAYLPDNVHPNAKAAAIYTNTVNDTLGAYLPTAPTLNIAHGVYITQTHLDTARLISAAAVSGCPIVDQVNPYLRQSLTCASGQSFSVGLKGTTIGLLEGLNAQTGLLTCQLDGGSAQIYDLRAPLTAPGDIVLSPIIRFSGLADTTHTLTCTASAGSGIVGGFMLSSAQSLNQ